ncbi:hypothetical protein HD596_005740 [Nonomuraea jabiensis]|uniref:Uncharacterized protein n=1 Tax=Nonomuraea jabiensis TaxID=882448 RepID=A0A7W9G848_9ACTN|nr:hypothetical protein [Nonomuraea jabiensis]
MEEFHGLHVKQLREGHVAIDWSGPMGRFKSVRVRGYTCDCLPTVYELCVAGGLGHIRRTERSSKGDRVSESPWLRDAEVKHLWHNLLEGHAR